MAGLGRKRGQARSSFSGRGPLIAYIGVGPRFTFVGDVTIEKGTQRILTLVVRDNPAVNPYNGFVLDDAAGTGTTYDGVDELTIPNTVPVGTYALKVRATSSGGRRDLSQTITIIERDTTAPVLTLPTDTKTGQTTATLTVTTDTGEGTLYTVCTTSSTPPTAAQVIAGQDHSGVAAAFSNSVAVTSTGTKTVSATGLTGSTAYTTFFVQKDAGNNVSAVSAADGFTTDGGFDYSALTAILSGNVGFIWDPANGALNFQDAGKTTPAGNGDPVWVAADANSVNDGVTTGSGARPTRTQGGGGEWYFNLSGAQTLGTGSITNMSVAHGEWFAAASVYAASWPATVPGVLAGDDASSHRNGQFLRVNNGTLETIAFNGASPTTNTYGSGLSAATFYRLSAEANFNGGSPTLTAYVNNVADTPSSAVLGTGGTGAIWLGSYNGGSFGDFLTGRVYRAFFVNRALTSGEKTSVDAFLNGNHP